MYLKTNAISGQIFSWRDSAVDRSTVEDIPTRTLHRPVRRSNRHHFVFFFLGVIRIVRVDVASLDVDQDLALFVTTADVE